MQYFDFNIPYLESPSSSSSSSKKSKKPPPDRSLQKQNRLRLVVKAIELGYSGIAYNRTIKGILSDSERCSISVFPLSSILKLSPSLSSSASLHRSLLGGLSHDTRFRQYTRLTVVVENKIQAQALKSGSSILKSYDLVAVKPVSQIAFDETCESSEVDIITIDFSEKLFKLKLPMIKTAVKRGIYFEITYSSFIEDIEARRRVIQNGNLLVKWTRGKNLIISSAAPSVHEFRGPKDAANLFSLLGLSTERAKAAMSKNCRSLIANVLLKKQSVKVELMPQSAQNDPQEPWIVDSMKWDPISSGEGDIDFDEMAKSFAIYNQVPQAVKPIDFGSISSSMPSSGSQAKDSFKLGEALLTCTTVNSIKSSACELGASRDREVGDLSLSSENDTELFNQTTISEVLQKFHSPNSKNGSSMASEQYLRDLGGIDADMSPVRGQDLRLDNHVSSSQADVTFDDNQIEAGFGNAELEMKCTLDANGEIYPEQRDLNLLGSQYGQSMKLENMNEISSTQNSMQLIHSPEMELGNQSNELLVSSKLSSVEDLLDDKDSYAKSASDVDDGMHVDICNEKAGDYLLVGNYDLSNDVMNDEDQAEHPEKQLSDADAEADAAAQVTQVSGPIDHFEDHDNEKAGTNASQLAEGSMLMEKTGEMNDGDNLICSNPACSDEVEVEDQKQGDVTSDNYSRLEEFPSVIKLKRRVSRPGCWVPFKHLWQLPFKRKGRTSGYKRRKK